MNRLFPLSTVLACVCAVSAAAGGTDCAPSETVFDWTADAHDAETYCRIIVAADASGVVARCGLDRGASTSVLDDTLAFSLTRGGESAGYYTAPIDTFEAGQTSPDIQTLLENAQTCLATDDCKTGPNPPDVVTHLANVHDPIGLIALAVSDQPETEEGGLFSGLDLGAGLDSALTDNPPVMLNFIMLGETPARVWEDPNGVGGFPSFNLQILSREANTCPK